MSLATRCTACGTIFRVVQDQLRVSEGWVRCGRCAEVFDAREQLFDIDRDTPPAWPADEIPAPVVEAIDVPLAPQEPTTWVQIRQPDIAPPAPATPAPPVIAPPDLPEQPAAVVDLARGERVEPHWGDAMPEPVEMGTGPDVVLAPHLEVGPATPATELPSFMRPAADSARWRKPAVRVALAAAALVLLALLGLQVTQHFHDALAALYPQARPALRAWCQASGCELQPWRRIDALSVETSALSVAPAASAANQYQLAVNVHNKSGVEVATPWVELSLLDGNGGVLLRRILAPADFAIPSLAIAPGGDLPMQALVATGMQRISGYSVEIFHP